MLIFFAFTSFFLYLLFPFNDLGDLVSSKVSEATGGQLYVTFDKLDISMFPSPGLALENVFVESVFFPGIKAQSLSASPSILGLMTFKPGVTIRGDKVLGGDFVLSTRGGGKTSNGKLKQKVDFEFENFKLTDIIGLLDAPIRASGFLTGEFHSQVDPEFSEQPSGDIKLNIKQALIEESDFTVQSMPLSIPKMNLDPIEIDAKSDKGNIEIKKLSIGKPGQDFSAQVNGRIQINFQKQGTNVFPAAGPYDLNIKLQIGEVVKQKLGPFLSLLNTYSTAQNTYSIKIAGNGFYGPPQSVTKGQ